MVFSVYLKGLMGVVQSKITTRCLMFSLSKGIASGLSEENDILLVEVGFNGILGGIVIQDVKDTVVECSSIAAVAWLKMVLAFSPDSVVSFPVSLLLLGTFIG